MELVVAEPVADVSGVGVVRHEEWRRRGSGGLQHTQIEATHWSAPAHTYGKVVEGVSCVGADGRSVRARRQVEVLSARAPGLLQVLKATHTHSHSSSSTFHKNFDDLQLTINPLDVSSQKERLNIGRSGMLSGRRPPSKLRSSATIAESNGSTVSKLCHWFDVDSQHQLQSPGIVASNGSIRNGRVTEDKCASDDRRSSSSDNTDFNDTSNDFINPNKSEDSLYDSCPEKESVFKDESGQLEEWRRASKVRRSLQYPCKSARLGSSKPADLPENWGSVSRIKQELENCQKNSLFSRSMKMSYNEDSALESSIQNDTISEVNENDADSASFDNFLIKPSILKKKSFITVDTLNEVRGKLKSMAEQDSYLLSQTQQQELDDGIVAEDTKHEDEENSGSKVSPPSVRSYVFGMEAMLNSYNQNKSYSGGTNSLESRVSKLINGMSARNDDWHARRKSYGFEKVQNQKSSSHPLSSHEKNNMESSTDSGICRSTEVMNMFGNYSNSKSEIVDAKRANSNRSTVITLGNSERKETFETWLINNRKPVTLGSLNGLKKNETSTDLESKLKKCNIQSSNQISISILDNKEQLSKKLNGTDLISDNYNKPTLMTDSVSLVSRQSEDFALKRHTIAVDAFKNGDFPNDIFEKKNKRVEFCKTEVHFTADSGRVNIVETDGKPPSTNNFRRRRRSSGVAPIRDAEKSSLPVTHFGDSLIEKKETEIQNNVVEENNALKLNYAIITEIKSNSKQNDSCEISDAQTHSNGSNEDTSESEQIRGILKNKPIKPKPYHLGEDKTILSEINPTHHTNSLERNLWGVKLKPIQDKIETPLWCSSVTLKSDVFKDSEFNEDTTKESNDSSKSIYGQTEILQNENTLSSQFSHKTQNEVKGYSTKINFGNGDPIVETSYNLKKNKLNTNPTTTTQGFNGVSNKMVKIEPRESNTTKQSTVVSKYLNSSINSFKSSQINDELKAVQKIKNTMSLDRVTEVMKESCDESEGQSRSSTFADQITTPRSLMPTRGSARKLKEHELSYFGVKTTSENKKTDNHKSPTKEISTPRNKPNVKTFEDTRYLKTTKEKASVNQSFQKNESFFERHPIYENVSLVNKKSSNEVSTKNINSGESIIDELTKAADEILQALHDYSDDDSGKMCYTSDKNSQPLSTISETNTWNDRSKEHKEHKAVQTILGGTRKYNSLTTKTNGKIRTSSNSSLESLTKESKVASSRKKTTPTVEPSVEKPERPQRRKVSSGDAVKARRLQRASSRDALLQIQGSSSEDISGHLEVVRKKTVRRSKHNGDVVKRSDSKVLSDSHSNTRSIDRKRESSKSSKYVSSTVPEIRHKTAISTIMSLSDRHSNATKSKSSSSDRSRHKERVREGTISSLARDKVTVKEKSTRSADTSLDRESGQSKDKSHRRDKSREKYKSHESSDKLKRITEELGSDAEKRNKTIFDKKSSGTSAVSSSARVQRSSHSTRPSDRQGTSGRVTNVRTEYDKSLRLI
ncbi:uncharacterized protein LOC143923222 [Arctopsyche grandis]|uniref:uncharacterized protein LOC143923222 n=1 Tax=Arctopsyche grandis TaxID=121162 RepID=UPI00406D7674